MFLSKNSEFEIFCPWVPKDNNKFCRVKNAHKRPWDAKTLAYVVWFKTCSELPSLLKNTSFNWLTEETALWRLRNLLSKTFIIKYKHFRTGE